MKKGSRKTTANSDNFNSLQLLRNVIMDFDVSNIRWCGRWNGMNWEKFSFYAVPETLEKIKDFVKTSNLNISFF